jgi:serine protease Do
VPHRNAFSLLAHFVLLLLLACPGLVILALALAAGKPNRPAAGAPAQGAGADTRPPARGSPPLPWDFAEVAGRARQSAVRVTVTSKNVLPRPEEVLMGKVSTPVSGLGSGVVVKASGGECLILTNHHVAGNADRITVRLHDRREFPATLLGTDPVTEVALLRARVTTGPVPEPVPVREADTVRVGEWARRSSAPRGISASLS